MVRGVPHGQGLVCYAGWYVPKMAVSRTYQNILENAVSMKLQDH